MASERGSGPSLEAIVVVGTGYVGLPMCLQLAKAGLRVTGVDIDEEVVRAINERRAKVEEKEGFEVFFQDPDVQINFSAATEPVKADAFIIAVPTPVEHKTKTADLSAVIAATESLVPHLQEGNLVVLVSTVPPFTTEKLVRSILERSGLSVGSDIFLAHCPERILPGNIMTEVVFNARIIGGLDPESSRRAAQLLGAFVKGKLLVTDARTAEFVKLIENSYRDVNVAFANQVALLCEQLGIETSEAIVLANHHPRVDILTPGIGVGGHCIPIDPWFLIEACPDSSSLLRAARELNGSMPQRTVDKILAAVEGMTNPRIVCLGATYKPNVKDVRESPALEVFHLLSSRGLDVVLYDPLVSEYACESVLAVARGADALAILVPHDLILTELRYRKQEILSAMRQPNLLAFTPGIF